MNSDLSSKPQQLPGFLDASSSVHIVPRCGLLVSVRDASEARWISELPVEIIDLKEPKHGPLAPCEAGVWEEAILGVPFAGKWSVALGEAADALRVASRVPRHAAFAKAGPSEIVLNADLVTLWKSLRKLLPVETELVAVAYADHEKACTLPANVILDLAIDEGFRTLLIDTYEKGAVNSIARLGVDGLRRLAERAAGKGLDIVLAGGLTLSDLYCLAGIPLRRIALRGAVCDGGREGSIQPEKVKEWADAVGKLAERTRDSCG